MKSKNKFGRLAIISCLCFILTASPKLVSASHNAGGALTYTHLSGNNYRFHAIYYRDCQGIPAPGSMNLVISSVSCNVNQIYTMIPLPGTGIEINLPCMGVSTDCTGGTAPGMQKWEYEVDVALPGQCPDWLFYFTDCCRNVAITTAQNPGSETLYVEAHLNNYNGENSSPQFTNDPLIFACMNQDFHYNNGMFDADGDSLVYNLICARSAPNTCVFYYPPHSAQQPFLSAPPITLDYFTGDYFMHPTAQEVGLVVYEVSDYRNGELMGSVMRDVMMYTIPCSNQNPAATHMNGTAQQIAYVFPNDTICFDIFSDDTDVLDSLTMTWNQVIPAATFSTAGAPHPTGTFCWIPSLNDVRSNPYMFTSMIRDNFCPLNNAGVYSYYIYVTLDSSLVYLDTKDFINNSSFSIYPNPSNGIFIVQSIQQFSQMTIYNSLGECVLKKNFENTIDLSEQPAGVYFVELTSQNGTPQIQKLIKE